MFLRLTKVLIRDLAVGQPVQVFLFRPKETFSISAAGGEKEIRRRSLQVVLTGDATLRYTGFDDKVPTWEATGEIDVQPAASCETERLSRRRISRSGRQRGLVGARHPRFGKGCQRGCSVRCETDEDRKPIKMLHQANQRPKTQA